MSIGELREDHRESRSRLRTLTLINRGLGLVLLGVIVGYLGSLYGKVVRMYAPENFQGPLQEEAESLLSAAEPELRLLWAETAPVYGTMALEKFEGALPEVQEASHRELAALRIDLTAAAEDRLQAALRRISTKHQERLGVQLPELAAVDGAERIGARWMETIEGDLESILLHFSDRYAEDLGQLAATLEQFRSDDFQAMSQDELMRHFVHLWLVKADRWVMLEEPGRGFEEAYHVD